MITIKHITSLIRKAKHIVNNYHRDIAATNNRINAVEKLIRERTDIHASIGAGTGNFVIVVGRYKDNDYIQIVDMPQRDLDGFIKQLREYTRYGKARTLDAPPNFSAAFRRDVLDD